MIIIEVMIIMTIRMIIILLEIIINNDKMKCALYMNILITLSYVL